MGKIFEGPIDPQKLHPVVSRCNFLLTAACNLKSVLVWLEVQMLGSKAVKHDAVSAELPMCADSFPSNLEKGMLFTLSWWVSLVFCKRKM